MMRIAALLIAVSPSFVFADTIVARISPTDVIVFTEGAEVIRKGQIDLPAGVHDIVIPDMRPHAGGPATPTVTITGASLISQKWQDQNPTPMAEPETAAYKTAKAALDASKDAVMNLEEEIAASLLAKLAATSQIDFLRSLATSGTLPNGIDTLRDLSRMISQETLSAHKAVQEAEILAQKLGDDLPDLQRAASEAQRVVDSLLPASTEFAKLTLTVSVPRATTSTLSLKYLTGNASWKPVYDLRLTTGDDPKLIFERAALLSQNSGERWKNVNLTLSTVSLGEWPEPNEIRTKRLRIFEPKPEVKMTLESRVQSDFASVLEPVIEAPVIVEEAASANADFSGIAVQYGFDYPVSLDSAEDFSRIALGSLDFDATLEALAVPLYNQSAFRMATFTNDSGERILPADAYLYVDNRLIADTFVKQIVPGAETEIGFGPIRGLRLTRTILNRNEGDRGIISRSNENTETIRIDVENLTEKAWNVTLLDRVPYTEQEDLSISWTATPKPTTVDHEDRRGVLHWDLDVGAGQTISIELGTKITWPEGMVLR